MEIEKKNIVSIVLNNFKNDSRVLKENISFKKFGYDPIIVAIHEKGLLENETIEGIPVFRIKLITKEWGKNKIVQFIKYLEFIIRVFVNFRKFNVFHCNDLNALVVGFLIKKISGKHKKLVYDAHEYEIERNGLSDRFKPVIYRIEKTLIKHVDHVITVSESISNEYKRLYNIEKPTVIFNAPYLRKVGKKNIFREKFNISEDQLIFLYQGGLFPGRGLNNLLEAFKQLPDNFCIVFMGYGPLEKEVKEFSNKEGNIFFHKSVSQDVLVNYTGSADFAFALVESKCLSYYYCMPNKLFEYVMAEVPVIVSNVFDMKNFVITHGVGKVIESNTVESLVDVIGKINDFDYESSIDSLKITKQKYNWEEEEKKLKQLYDNI